MPKAWKETAREAAGKKVKSTPNQIVRRAGYDDSFFNHLASYQVKVADAKLCGDYLRVKLEGATGNSYSQTISLSVFAEGAEVPVDAYARKISQAHQVIAQHNHSIRQAPATRQQPAAA